MMERVSVLAITKNGVEMGKEIACHFPAWKIFAPEKLSDSRAGVAWFAEPVSSKIAQLFRENDALVCLFSLGAVVRLIAPHLGDKKSDPAVIVIDDRANFVISALSGHLGGANELARSMAERLGATAVITTAADVNETIAVDLVGREFGWTIQDDSVVTRASAAMVNREKIGVFQDAGQKEWWKGNLPKNVTRYDSMESLIMARPAAALIISDMVFDTIPENSVVYRPKTLVVGIGLHRDTAAAKIQSCLHECLERFSLSPRSIVKLVSIRKPVEVAGLAEFAAEAGIPVEYIKREDLAGIKVPNPSDAVKAFEGTPSVSEAAALLASGGSLVMEKQKFPPDLTISIARMQY